MVMEYYEAIGRRKTATARVRLYPGGDGNLIINDRPLREYLPLSTALVQVLGPLEAAEALNRLNVSVKVSGGGIHGQAGAIQLGIARALLKMDPGLRSLLRQRGFLTRDTRVKERKKPGLKRARKAPQYTKR
jgi:small subunit ribosomal protein S9